MAVEQQQDTGIIHMSIAEAVAFRAMSSMDTGSEHEGAAGAQVYELESSPAFPIVVTCAVACWRTLCPFLTPAPPCACTARARSCHTP